MDIAGQVNEECRDATWDVGDETVIESGCRYCAKLAGEANGKFDYAH